MANKEITNSDTPAACTANLRRSLGVRSATKPRKIGAAPGGSKITKRVTKLWIAKVIALTSAIFMRLPPFEHQP